MIGNSSVIAIIPARGGSKGLPGKNIRPLLGKPLIAWSIEQALSSKTVDEVLVTTDCSKIREIAQSFGASVPFVRPSELAADDSTSIDVVVHAHQFYQTVVNKKFDYSVLVEPTAPVREKTDIDDMVFKLNNLSDLYDGIVSVGEVSEHPSIIKICEENKIYEYFPKANRGSRRQDYERVYWPYGGLFVNKTEVMLKEKSHYSKRLTYFKLKKYQCCEIDDIFDFVKTEAIMKQI
jgi:CMP-N,N'-diacetyllegionaminic acid synthase